MKIKYYIIYNTITAITNLIGTVSDEEVTTSQFPVGTSGQLLATVGELYYKIIKLTNNNQIQYNKTRLKTFPS